MTEAAQADILAGIYRRLGKVSEQLALIGSVLERASGVRPVVGPRPTPLQPETPPMLRTPMPEQGELPLAGCVLAHKPRVWGNTVKVYEYLAGSFAGSFTLKDMLHRETEITHRTGGKIGVATYQRVLSALVRAGAATRKGGAYTLREPTDELREAVERTAKKRAAAKEVSA
jgi:hypothetical protein